MKLVRKTYIEFLGSNYSKRLIRKVKTRNPAEVKVLEEYHGFRFFDILSVVVNDGQRVELKSERTNVSPNHYWGGKLYALAEFKREFPNNCGLLKSLKLDRDKRVIRYEGGYFNVINKSDIFVAGPL